MDTAVELTPSLPPPKLTFEPSSSSSLHIKLPPRRQQGLFAPSEYGDSTDAESSSSSGNEQEDAAIPLEVEASANSIGESFLQRI